MTNKAKASVGDLVYVNRHTHGVKLGEGRVTRVLPGDEINVTVIDPRGEIKLENVPWTDSESGDGWLTRADGSKFLAGQQPAVTDPNAPPSQHPSGYRDAPAGSDPMHTPQSLPQVQQNAVRPVAGMTGSTDAHGGKHGETSGAPGTPIGAIGSRANVDGKFDGGIAGDKVDGGQKDGAPDADQRSTANAPTDRASRERAAADSAAKAKADADLAASKANR